MAENGDGHKYINISSVIYLFMGVPVDACEPKRSQKEGLDIGASMSYHITYDLGGPDMTTLTASEARKRLYTLVDDVAESHEEVQIVGKRNTAILVSEEDWHAIQETLYLTSIPGMRESIRKGLNTPVDECDEELDW